MRKIRNCSGLSVLALVASVGISASAAALPAPCRAAVTLESLLSEMVDLDRATYHPGEVRVRQWTSRDPASVAPDRPGWFANDDQAHFLRLETNGVNRVEEVLADAKGPGAIVRFWMTQEGVKPEAGLLRIYLDGAATPAIEGTIQELLSCHGLAPKPLAFEQCRACNFYLPIPFARGCKVTVVREGRKGRFYYNIETRAYPPGTEVETYSAVVRERAAGAIAAACDALTKGPQPSAGEKKLAKKDVTLAPGQELALELKGPAAIRRLSVDAFEAMWRDRVPMMRELTIALEFDGARTAEMPLPMLFGAGASPLPFRTFVSENARGRDGLNGFVLRRTMPFAKSARVVIRNDAKSPAVVGKLELAYGPYAWDAARSLHFAAEYRARPGIRTREADGVTHRDLTFLESKGAGVVVGAAVSVLNTDRAWWGEGDEKIYVDGESLPSVFGTGSEDFFGYAWGSGERFSTPFFAQPDGAGAVNPGQVINLRHFLLDGLPYGRSVRFDMELWHWKNCLVNYDSVVWYYRRPAASGAGAPEAVEILPNGATRIPSAGVTAEPIFFLPKSMGCAAYADDKTVPREGQTPFGIRTLLGAREKIFRGETFYSQSTNGCLAVRHRFVGVADTPAAGLYASFPLMIKTWKGGKVVFDGATTVELPRAENVLKGRHISASRATACGPDGRERFSVRFAKPQVFEVYDGRSWGGPSFVFRAKAVPRDRFRAGETNEISYCLSTPGGLSATTGPVTLAAGADWTPLARFTPFMQAGSALDWTHLRPTGQPAGKDGFLRANGQDFVFERKPGEKVRFYGVNICGDMCWGLTDGEDDRFAENLARIGYNSLRIHHHDSGLSAGPDRTELNKANMARLDRLVKACVDHGLYLTTDLYVSRSLTYRQLGVDREGRPPYEAIKPLFYVSEVAFSNFLAFARNFLNHVNPHTGRRYADEPAMPLLSLVNEGSLGMDGMSGVKLFADIYRPAYAKWLAAKKASDPAFADVKIPEPFPGNIYDGSSKDTQAFLLFCGELEHRFAARVRAFLRDEIRAKALVTDMNIAYAPAVYAKTRDAFHDYVDIHFYVDHPSFPEKAWSLPNYRLNASPLGDYRVGPKRIAPLRHLDRPFCVTEFNFCGPGRFRSQSGLTLGTLAGLQNWAGVWRFAWSHHVARHRGYDREIMGGFDLVTDPAKIAEERAGLLLFGFGDLAEAGGTSAIVLPRETLDTLDGKGSRFFDRLGIDFLPYVRKVGVVLGDRAPEDAETLATWRDWAHPTRAETRARWYPDGKIRGPSHVLDVDAGSLVVRTPRVAGGFAERGEIRAGRFVAKLGGSPAAVWAAAVDGKSLAESDRIVVSHVTELQNSGSVFADLACRYLLDRGKLPYLVRNGTAEVSLAVREGHWKVYALETSGQRGAEIPSRVAGGRLSFTADVARDKTNATFLYELESAL